MINSIYTHKEIFLRELISNGSDAIDKRHFRSLTDTSLGLDLSAYKIHIESDKENRILTVSDNGCGMGEKELEENRGTIAKSGSLDWSTARPVPSLTRDTTRNLPCRLANSGKQETP